MFLSQLKVLHWSGFVGWNRWLEQMVGKDGWNEWKSLRLVSIEYT